MIYNNYGINTGISYEKQDWNVGLPDVAKAIIKENDGKFNWLSKEWIIASNKLEAIITFEKDWYKEYFKDRWTITKEEYDNIEF
jgi:hypothetical protein